MNYFYSKVLLFAFPHYITHPAQSVQSGITNTLFDNMWTFLLLESS